jgi:hypothetical protein
LRQCTSLQHNTQAGAATLFCTYLLLLPLLLLLLLLQAVPRVQGAPV